MVYIELYVHMYVTSTKSGAISLYGFYSVKNLGNKAK